MGRTSTPGFVTAMSRFNTKKETRISCLQTHILSEKLINSVRAGVRRALPVKSLHVTWLRLHWTLLEDEKYATEIRSDQLVQC